MATACPSASFLPLPLRAVPFRRLPLSMRPLCAPTQLCTTRSCPSEKQMSYGGQSNVDLPIYRIMVVWCVIAVGKGTLRLFRFEILRLPIRPSRTPRWLLPGFVFVVARACALHSSSCCISMHACHMRVCPCAQHTHITLNCHRSTIVVSFIYWHCENKSLSIYWHLNLCIRRRPLWAPMRAVRWPSRQPWRYLSRRHSLRCTRHHCR